MSNRTALRLIVVLCVVSVLLVLPAVASAANPCVAAGTVTAASTGAKLAGIEVSVYYRVSGSSGSWGESTETDADGMYTLDFYPSGPASFTVVAKDKTGIYDAAATADSSIALGEDKTVNLALSKDALAPVVEMHSNRRFYLSVAAAASLPDDIDRWAIMSDGTDPLMIGADDGQSFWTRYSSFTNGSGIQSTGWAVDGGPWTLKTTAEARRVDWWNNRPIWVEHEIPMLSEGVHAVNYRATDVNGNTSADKSTVVVVDKTAPVTSVDTKASSKTTIKLASYDALVGVLATFFRTGTTGTFEYGTSISVPATGEKNVQFYSQDKIGNVEAVKNLRILAPAGLSTPRVSTKSVSSKKSFKVTGSVSGRSKAKGYINIYKFKNGSYKYVSRKAFTEGSNGRFSISLKLSKGVYRFKSSYGGYTATSVDPPVTSGRSAKVRIR